jgi:hypothetical protein
MLPTLIRRPSTRPLAPFPEIDWKSVQSKSANPRRLTSATIAAASGCSDFASPSNYVRHPRLSFSERAGLVERNDLNCRRTFKILRQQDASETAFLQKVSNLMLEFMIANLLRHAIEKNDQNFEEFRRKILALVAENEADAAKIPWVARLVERRRRH